ncbi:hypothetical protein DIPPA_32553 [Diplonema papillatum]|nr:hypothetical protein DIPPA_32553 [Diplonema papillatum]
MRASSEEDPPIGNRGSFVSRRSPPAPAAHSSTRAVVGGLLAGGLGGKDASRGTDASGDPKLGQKRRTASKGEKSDRAKPVSTPTNEREQRVAERERELNSLERTLFERERVVQARLSCTAAHEASLADRAARASRYKTRSKKSPQHRPADVGALLRDLRLALSQTDPLTSVVSVIEDQAMKTSNGELAGGEDEPETKEHLPRREERVARREVELVAWERALQKEREEMQSAMAAARESSQVRDRDLNERHRSTAGYEEMHARRMRELDEATAGHAKAAAALQEERQAVGFCLRKIDLAKEENERVKRALSCETAALAKRKLEVERVERLAEAQKADWEGRLACSMEKEGLLSAKEVSLRIREDRIRENEEAAALRSMELSNRLTEAERLLAGQGSLLDGAASLGGGEPLVSAALERLERRKRILLAREENVDARMRAATGREWSLLQMQEAHAGFLEKKAGELRGMLEEARHFECASLARIAQQERDVLLLQKYGRPTGSSDSTAAMGSAGRATTTLSSAPSCSEPTHGASPASSPKVGKRPYEVFLEACARGKESSPSPRSNEPNRLPLTTMESSRVNQLPSPVLRERRAVFPSSDECPVTSSPRITVRDAERDLLVERNDALSQTVQRLSADMEAAALADKSVLEREAACGLREADLAAGEAALRHSVISHESAVARWKDAQVEDEKRLAVSKEACDARHDSVEKREADLRTDVSRIREFEVELNRKARLVEQEGLLETELAEERVQIHALRTGKLDAREKDLQDREAELAAHNERRKLLESELTLSKREADAIAAALAQQQDGIVQQKAELDRLQHQLNVRDQKTAAEADRAKTLSSTLEEREIALTNRVAWVESEDIRLSEEKARLAKVEEVCKTRESVIAKEAEDLELVRQATEARAESLRAQDADSELRTQRCNERESAVTRREEDWAGHIKRLEGREAACEARDSQLKTAEAGCRARANDLSCAEVELKRGQVALAQREAAIAAVQEHFAAAEKSAAERESVLREAEESIARDRSEIFKASEELRSRQEKVAAREIEADQERASIAVAAAILERKTAELEAESKSVGKREESAGRVTDELAGRAAAAAEAERRVAKRERVVGEQREAFRALQKRLDDECREVSAREAKVAAREARQTDVEREQAEVQNRAVALATSEAEVARLTQKVNRENSALKARTVALQEEASVLERQRKSIHAQRAECKAAEADLASKEAAVEIRERAAARREQLLVGAETTRDVVEARERAVAAAESALKHERALLDENVRNLQEAQAEVVCGRTELSELAAQRTSVARMRAEAETGKAAAKEAQESIQQERRSLGQQKEALDEALRAIAAKEAELVQREIAAAFGMRLQEDNETKCEELFQREMTLREAEQASHTERGQVSVLHREAEERMAAIERREGALDALEQEKQDLHHQQAILEARQKGFDAQKETLDRKIREVEEESAIVTEKSGLLAKREAGLSKAEELLAEREARALEGDQAARKAAEEVASRAHIVEAERVALRDEREKLQARAEAVATSERQATERKKEVNAEAVSLQQESERLARQAARLCDEGAQVAADRLAWELEAQTSHADAVERAESFSQREAALAVGTADLAAREHSLAQKTADLHSEISAFAYRSTTVSELERRVSEDRCTVEQEAAALGVRSEALQRELAELARSSAELKQEQEELKSGKRASEALADKARESECKAVKLAEHAQKDRALLQEERAAFEARCAAVREQEEQALRTLQAAQALEKSVVEEKARAESLLRETTEETHRLTLLRSNLLDEKSKVDAAAESCSRDTALRKASLAALQSKLSEQRAAVAKAEKAAAERETKLASEALQMGAARAQLETERAEVEARALRLKRDECAAESLLKKSTHLEQKLAAQRGDADARELALVALENALRLREQALVDEVIRRTATERSRLSEKEAELEARSTEAHAVLKDRAVLAEAQAGANEREAALRKKEDASRQLELDLQRQLEAVAARESAVAQSAADLEERGATVAREEKALQLHQNEVRSQEAIRRRTAAELTTKEEDVRRREAGVEEEEKRVALKACESERGWAEKCKEMHAARQKLTEEVRQAFQSDRDTWERERSKEAARLSSLLLDAEARTHALQLAEDAQASASHEVQTAKEEFQREKADFVRNLTSHQERVQATARTEELATSMEAQARTMERELRCRESSIAAREQACNHKERDLTDRSTQAAMAAWRETERAQKARLQSLSLFFEQESTERGSCALSEREARQDLMEGLYKAFEAAFAESRAKLIVQQQELEERTTDLCEREDKVAGTEASLSGMQAALEVENRELVGRTAELSALQAQQAAHRAREDAFAVQRTCLERVLAEAQQEADRRLNEAAAREAAAADREEAAACLNEELARLEAWLRGREEDVAREEEAVAEDKRQLETDLCDLDSRCLDFDARLADLDHRLDHLASDERSLQQRRHELADRENVLAREETRLKDRLVQFDADSRNLKQQRKENADTLHEASQKQLAVNQLLTIARKAEDKLAKEVDELSVEKRRFAKLRELENKDSITEACVASKAEEGGCRLPAKQCAGVTCGFDAACPVSPVGSLPRTVPAFSRAGSHPQYITAEASTATSPPMTPSSLSPHASSTNPHLHPPNSIREFSFTSECDVVPESRASNDRSILRACWLHLLYRASQSLMARTLVALHKKSWCSRLFYRWHAKACRAACVREVKESRMHVRSRQKEVEKLRERVLDSSVLLKSALRAVDDAKVLRKNILCRVSAVQHRRQVQDEVRRWFLRWVVSVASSGIEEFARMETRIEALERGDASPRPNRRPPTLAASSVERAPRTADKSRLGLDVADRPATGEGGIWSMAQVTAVHPGTPAFFGGIFAGDVVVGLDSHNVTCAADFKAAPMLSGSVTVSVCRHRKVHHVAIDLDTMLKPGSVMPNKRQSSSCSPLESTPSPAARDRASCHNASPVSRPSRSVSTQSIHVRLPPPVDKVDDLTRKIAFPPRPA